MVDRRIELALRRQRLRARIAAQRHQFTADLAVVAPWLGAADRVRAAVQAVRRNPEWLVAGAAVIVVARPRAALRWLRRSVVVWQFWRRARDLLASMPGTARRQT